LTDLWRCRTKVFRDSAVSLFALVFHPSLAQSMLTGGTTMRRTLFVVLLAVLSLGFVRAQRQPYRVAFDLTSRDTLEQKAVLRWLKEVSTSSPDAQMEVVMYAKGFDLVMPERSAYIADVKEAMKNPNVAFKVCAIALKNNNVDKSQLLPGVQTVPDGIHELVMKQQDHWGYIKVMH
jgi:uncharacterized protein